jgi:Tfp pilus assembly protein PilE
LWFLAIHFTNYGQILKIVINFYSTMSENDYIQNQYQYDDNVNYAKKPTINLLEIFLVLVSILILVITFIFGYLSQNKKTTDQQKAIDINNIVIALENFYQNSSVNPSSREYPKVSCSSDLNEVDFEFSLREHLTGKRVELDTHEYIKPEDFPFDRSGKYSKTLSNRKLPYRCSQNISKNTTDPIYSADISSCNFSSVNPKFSNCYIYTASSNGDTFEIGYYSVVNKNFVTYRKFRESPIERTN